MDFTNWTITQYADKLIEVSDAWRLRERQGNDFARGKFEVCRDIAQRIARDGHFASDRQKAYAEKLILWVQPRVAVEAAASPYEAARIAFPETPAAAPVVVSDPAMQRINALFGLAREHGLQRPRIRLNLNGTRLSLAPGRPGSAFERDIWVNGPNRERFGRINAQGQYLRGCDATPAVQEMVGSFGSNPVAIARAHGLATGSCCFCGLTLTDARSVAVGYGPICAQHYGLPWGDERASSVVTIDQVERRMNAIVQEGDREEARLAAAREHRQRLIEEGMARGAQETERRQAAVRARAAQEAMRRSQISRATGTAQESGLDYTDEDEQFQ